MQIVIITQKTETNKAQKRCLLQTFYFDNLQNTMLKTKFELTKEVIDK